MTNSDSHPKDGIDRFFDLHDQQSLIEARLASASPVAADLLRTAQARARQEIERLSGDDQIIEGLSGIYAPYAAQKAELEELEPLVEYGLLDASEIDAKRLAVDAELNTNPHLRIAAKYAGRLAAFHHIAPDTTEPEVPSAQVSPGYSLPASADPAMELPSGIAVHEPAPEDEDNGSRKHLRPLTITQNGHVLKIGSTGRVVPLANPNPRQQRSYAPHRLKALGVLADNSGNILTTSELWEGAFPGVPVDPTVMGHVRPWFDKFTLHKQPVIEQTHKRGKGAKYGIPRFDVTLLTDPNTPYPYDFDTLFAPYETRHRGPNDLDTQEDESECGFPLTIEQSAVFAKFLELNSDVFKELGFPSIDEAAVTALTELVENDSRLRKVDDKDIEQARRSGVERLQEFFSNEDDAITTIGRIRENDARYPLLTFLFDIETEERWALLDELASAKHGLVVTSNIRRNLAEQISKVSSVTELGNGKRIIAQQHTITTQEESVHTGTITSETLTVEPVLGSLTIGAAVESAQPEQPYPLYPFTPDKASDDPESEGIAPLPMQVEAFKEMATEWLEEIRKFGFENKRSESIRGFQGWGWLTPQALRGAYENGYLDRSTLDLSASELLTLRALREMPEIMSVRRSSTRLNRREVIKAIKSVIQSEADK